MLKPSLMLLMISSVSLAATFDKPRSEMNVAGKMVNIILMDLSELNPTDWKKRNLDLYLKEAAENANVSLKDAKQMRKLYYLGEANGGSGFYYYDSESNSFILSENLSPELSGNLKRALAAQARVHDTNQGPMRSLVYNVDLSKPQIDALQSRAQQENDVQDLPPLPTKNTDVVIEQPQPSAQNLVQEVDARVINFLLHDYKTIQDPEARALFQKLVDHYIGAEGTDEKTRMERASRIATQIEAMMIGAVSGENATDLDEVAKLMQGFINDPETLAKATFWGLKQYDLENQKIQTQTAGPQVLETAQNLQNVENHLQGRNQIPLDPIQGENRTPQKIDLQPTDRTEPPARENIPLVQTGGELAASEQVYEDVQDDRKQSKRDRKKARVQSAQGGDEAPQYVRIRKGRDWEIVSTRSGAYKEYLRSTGLTNKTVRFSNSKREDGQSRRRARTIIR